MTDVDTASGLTRHDELQIMTVGLVAAMIAGPITDYLRRPQRFEASEELDEAVDEAFRSWMAVRDRIEVRLLPDLFRRGQISQEVFDGCYPDFPPA